MGYKKKIKNLRDNYPELSNDKIFILNSYAEHIKDNDLPEVADLMMDWSKEEVAASMRYLTEVKEIYATHDMIKLLVIVGLSFGLLYLVYKTVNAAFIEGYVTGRKVGFAKAFDAIKKFTEGKENGDVVASYKNDDGSHTYVVARTTKDLPEGMSTDHLV